MNDNDERSFVPIDADRLIVRCPTQGNNVTSVLNSNLTTFKIDKLCIKLGIVKEKGDAQKCNHFSIRGYVAGMRENGSKNVLPFAEQLPPMDVPNFRYWLCQRCLQNNGTENNSKAYDEVAELPFGEGTSGVKPVDNRNYDENIVSALQADESQPSQEIPEKVTLSREIPEKVKVSLEFPKFCSINTNVIAPGNQEINENPQETSVRSLVSQPNESGQPNESPNGNPRRKARKVRLLKELLCGSSQPIESGQQKNESSHIKRKIIHDDDHDHDHDNDDQKTTDGKKLKTFKGNYRDLDHDHDQISADRKKIKAFKGNDLDHDQRSADGKKIKAFKGNQISKNSAAETSRNPETSKNNWKKHEAEKNSTLGKVGSVPMTAWRTIFSDMGRTDNQVPPSYGVSKCRGTTPCSNFMGKPKSNKKVNFSKKITNFSENSRKSKDFQLDRELGLGLSLNYDPQSQVRSPPFVSNRTSSHDHSRKDGFFMGESSFASRIPLELKSKEGLGHDVSNINASRTAFLQEKLPYTQPQYGSCSGHQKLDFCDPHKRNTVVRGYSDEHEIIELMARNQYERNLCEARSHFAPNAPGFNNFNMNEGMTRITNRNVGPTTTRNPNSGSGFFHQEQVSSFKMFDGQNQPYSSGVWISDSRHQIPQNSRCNNFSNGNNKNMSFGQQFSQPYGKFSEKDKRKNMMDLDLNVVAPNVEEQNNLENLRSLDSSYSNEAITAMQLLSLMDAGKSTSQPFNKNGQKFSPCYSNCSSTVTEKTNLMVNFPFPYSGLRPGVQNPIPSSFSGVFQTGQYVKPISRQSQQVYHKLINDGAIASRFNSLKTEICAINRNPSDFTTPGPENVYMINPEDLRFESGNSGKYVSENAYGSKRQNISGFH